MQAALAWMDWPIRMGSVILRVHYCFVVPRIVNNEHEIKQTAIATTTTTTTKEERERETERERRSNSAVPELSTSLPAVLVFLLVIYFLIWGAGMACWVARGTRNEKVASSNLGRSEQENFLLQS